MHCFFYEFTCRLRFPYVSKSQTSNLTKIEEIPIKRQLEENYVLSPSRPRQMSTVPRYEISKCKLAIVPSNMNNMDHAHHHLISPYFFILIPLAGWTLVGFFFSLAFTSCVFGSKAMSSSVKKRSGKFSNEKQTRHSS